MPKLQAAVPAGAPPNALLRVRLPDGSEVNVRVPEGLKPGDEFIFEVNSSSAGVSVTTSSVPTPSGGGGGGAAVGPTKPGGGGGNKKGGGAGKASKNPKKRRGHNNAGHVPSDPNGGWASSHGRDRDPHHAHRADGGYGGDGPRGLFAGFVHIYNQVYDILSQQGGAEPHPAAETLPPSRPSPSATRPTGRGRSHATSPVAQSPPPHLSARVTSAASVGFLDRELASGRDFLTALGVGMLIGLSIVAGFVAGVLHVTPIPEEVEAASSSSSSS